MRVITFKEAGVRVGDAHEDDGIGLVLADSEDEVGEFGRDVAEASGFLGGGEALNCGVVDRLGRFFVESEEIEDDF